jgi:hypothetical protein
MYLLADAGSTWATLGVVIAGMVALVGAIWRLGNQVAAWRDEAAASFGEFCALVIDWMRAVSIHNRAQDIALTKVTARLQGLERVCGQSVGELYVSMDDPTLMQRAEMAAEGIRPPGTRTRRSDGRSGGSDSKGER